MENNISNSDETEMVLENNDASVLASRWSRLWATLIDALTIIPITIPLMYFTGGFDGISEGIEASFFYTLSISLVGIVIFLIIHGKFIIRDGQTLGKKTQNIKIVTTEGLHANTQVLAKRYGFSWCVPLIPIFGPFMSIVNILFVFSKSKRCLHDYIGGTKVIIANK